MPSYKTYVIADNVGGRFSVLTPVGLLPIAVAGYDIRALVEGARNMQKATLDGSDTSSLVYAQTRNALYRAGKKIEILVNYNPKFAELGFDGRGLLLVARFLQQSEHVALVGLDTRLIERVDPENIATDATGGLEEVDQRAQSVFVQCGNHHTDIVNYNPKLHFMGEWWKQLYGESEGKDGKGIFPAAVDNTTYPVRPSCSPGRCACRL